MRLFILLCSLMSGIASAQMVWLDENWQVVSNEQLASFYVKEAPVEQDGLWKATIYYVGSDTPRYKGSFVESGIYTKASGAYEFFYPNGQLESDGRRSADGMFEGLTRFYDEAGVLTGEGHFVASKRQGTQKSYYPNGQLKEVYEQLNNQRVGKDVHYYEDGSLQAQHSFVNGKSDGEQLEYWPGGILRESQNYLVGKRFGQSKIYNADGSLYSITTYGANGKREGKAETFWGSGERETEYHYVNDQYEGKAQSWYQNGQLRWQGQYHKNKLDGESRFYDKQGELTRIENHLQDKKVGKQQYFYSNSTQLRRLQHYDEQGRLTLEQEFTRDGDKTKELMARFTDDKEFQEQRNFKDGQLTEKVVREKAKDWSLREVFNAEEQLIEREELRNGKLEGLKVVQGFWAGKYTESINFKAGKRHGSYERKFDSGNRLEKGEYANNSQVGQWLIQDDDTQRIENYDSQSQLHGEVKETVISTGQLLMQKHYQHGSLHGVHEKYNEQGQLLMQKHYQHGSLHGEYEKYNEQGQLQAKGRYVKDVRDGYWQYQAPYVHGVEMWQGEYQQGKKIGHWKALSAAGYEVGREYYDAEGLPQGSFYYFRENGLLKKVLRHKNGKLHGDSVNYLLGKPWSIETYNNGSIEKTDYINENDSSASGNGCESLLFGC